MRKIIKNTLIKLINIIQFIEEQNHYARIILRENELNV